MNVIEAIQSRRSIRKFTDEKVPKELLIKLADMGRIAPSASNLQAWKFLFITEPLLVEKVDMFSPGLSGSPPVILVICSDMEYVKEHGSRNSEIYGCMMDASMAAENIMLTAPEYGLGTCAIKSYNDAVVKKLLHLPDTCRIEMLMSIGYPKGEPRAPRRKSLEEVVMFNQWEDTNAN